MKRSIAFLTIALALAWALPVSAGEFSQPKDDVWLGGPPSEADLDAMAEAGVGLVIDLRTTPEGIEDTERAAQERGLRYLNLPLGRELAEGELITRVGSELEASLASGEGVLLHCASGNRAGEVWALHRVAQGANAQQALEQAEASGTRDERLERLRDVLEPE
ncbi:MAG: hypothetical protein EA417_10155 [Gammaproteobacteria bacterium]|nr:MAG: hypothetical protein EA417_10155 [Gammaproteobacteria bacterium]